MLTLAVKPPVRGCSDRPPRLRELVATPTDEPFGNRSRQLFTERQALTPGEPKRTPASQKEVQEQH